MLLFDSVYKLEVDFEIAEVALAPEMVAASAAAAAAELEATQA